MLRVSTESERRAHDSRWKSIKIRVLTHSFWMGTDYALKQSESCTSDYLAFSVKYQK